MKDPRAAAGGKQVDALADLVDLFPTIAGAAGLPLPPNRHGASVMRPLAGEPVRDHVFSQLHLRNATRPHYGVRTEEWKLALYEPGEEQLFDFRNDPDETHNVYTQHPERVEELRGMLAQDLALT